MNEKILLVEDDSSAGVLLKSFLEKESYEVTLCPTAKSGLQSFIAESHQLCLLDLSLPDFDGFELACEIRRRDENVPLIFLTARSLLDDKIRGFQSGADDYITKPFEAFELVYKIKAILKRMQVKARRDTPVTIGAYQFDSKNQTLTHKGTSKRITARENEILKLLCHRKNQITRRDDILLALWGESDYFKGRSLDVFIAKLRKYFSEDAAIRIENVHGVGFILSDLAVGS